MYKIIHDLRHPTEYLADGLTQLSKELASDVLKNDPKLILLDQKVYSYANRAKFKRALTSLTNHISSLGSSRTPKATESKLPSFLDDFRSVQQHSSDQTVQRAIPSQQLMMIDTSKRKVWNDAFKDE